MLSGAKAKALDVDLMSSAIGFTLVGLMELAGLAVSRVVAIEVPLSPTDVGGDRRRRRALALAGPGNNGGDALVASRHLMHYGYDVDVYYPKIPNTNNDVFVGLVSQLEALDVSFVPDCPDPTAYDVVVDGIFGFSFDANRTVRPPFDGVLRSLRDAKQKATDDGAASTTIVSVDVPSGWSVDDVDNVKAHGRFEPDVLVSLSAPKTCSAEFAGRHYVGGRFVPPSLAKKYEIDELLKGYDGTTDQIFLLPKT